MLAGLTKGPSYFSPDRHPDRARERLAYVLDRMQEDGDHRRRSRAPDARAGSPAPDSSPTTSRPRYRLLLRRSCRAARLSTLAGIRPAHRGGLYGARDHPAGAATGDRGCPAGGTGPLRMRNGRGRIPRGRRPISRASASNTRSKAAGKLPMPPSTAWAAGAGCGNARPPLYDVHWTTAVVVGAADRGKKGDAAWLAPVGLARRPHSAALGRHRGRAAQALRCRVRQCPRGPKHEGQAAGGPSCGCARRCKAPRSCWTTRPAASWRWQADSPIR